MDNEENITEENAENVVDSTIELTEDLIKLNDGKTALKEEQIPTAIMSFKEALEINPELFEAAFHLGEAYVIYEDYENSVDAFSKSANYDLSKVYDYIVTIAPKVGISVDDILKAMVQDFDPI